MWLPYTYSVSLHITVFTLIAVIKIMLKIIILTIMTIITITTIIIIKADFLVRLYIITRSIYRQKITPKVIIIVINICIYIHTHTHTHTHTYTCFVLPRTHQCGSGWWVENNWYSVLFSIIYFIYYRRSDSRILRYLLYTEPVRQLSDISIYLMGECWKTAIFCFLWKLHWLE